MSSLCACQHIVKRNYRIRKNKSFHYTQYKLEDTIFNVLYHTNLTVKLYFLWLYYKLVMQLHGDPSIEDRIIY